MIVIVLGVQCIVRKSDALMTGRAVAQLRERRHDVILHRHFRRANLELPEFD
jgi:hypothetical protein